MLKFRLWHSPYNSGAVWFDWQQRRRFSWGWNAPERNAWKGGTDRKLWWCLLGFCGSFTIQTWPWQRRPNDNAEL